MRREDVERALDALASDAPAPTADAAALIARGRRRIVRQRVVIVVIAAAVVAAAAGVGAVANNHDGRRVVAPTPTTTSPGFGPSREIAVASSLEAWKCLNPLQYTDDGGRSWKSITLPTRVPSDLVSGCTAVAGGNAWATWRDAKNEFHLLRIRGGDDPQVFSFPRLPESTGLVALTFVDRDHGWAQTSPNDDSGPPTHLYRTVDGGATWKLSATNVGGGPIAFTDMDHGWSSDGADLSYTGDGGVTWRAVALPAPVVATGPVVLFQIAARDDWIVVWRGVPLSGNRYRPFFDFSTDGGRTWLLRAGPDDFELPHAENNAFDAIAGRSWVMTSGNALRITTDSGEWQTRPDMPAGGYVGRIYFPTSDIGWATTSTGAILRTADSGRMWTDVTNGAATTTSPTVPAPPQQALPIQMAFVSAREGWLCSTNPLLFTVEAGTNWRSVGYSTSPPVPPSYQQPLCAAVPGGDGWVLQASVDPRQPQLLHFRRGGESQDDPLPFARLPDATRIAELTFADRDHAWALRGPTASGKSSALYRTDDGGRKWSIVNEHPPVAIHFTSATDGWGIRSPDLEHTTDGGRTWRSVAVPIPTPIPGGFEAETSDLVVNSSAIVVLGHTPTGSLTGLFFDVSTDGARTWTMHTGRPPHESVGTTEPQAFAALDADHWQFAASNALYVTADRGDTWTRVAEFAGVQSISSVAFLTPDVGFVSALGSDGATVVLGTTDGGASWTTVEGHNLPQHRPQIAPIPGGIIGCPTRRLTPAGPTTQIAQAALAYLNFPRASVSAVYRANSTQGEFADVFSFNVGSCGSDILDNIWVAYVHGAPNAGRGGSTGRVALALAHYADGWHVFGRYP